MKLETHQNKELYTQRQVQRLKVSDKKSKVKSAYLTKKSKQRMTQNKTWC